MSKTKNTKHNANTNANNEIEGDIIHLKPQDPWEMTQTPIFADFDIKNKRIRGSMLYIDFLSSGELTKIAGEIPKSKMLFVRRKEFFMPQGFFVVDYQDPRCIDQIVKCANQMGQTKVIYIFNDATKSFVKKLRTALNKNIQLGILSIKMGDSNKDTTPDEQKSSPNPK